MKEKCHMSIKAVKLSNVILLDNEMSHMLKYGVYMAA